jgi:molybdate transport system substrate-binding protein
MERRGRRWWLEALLLALGVVGFGCSPRPAADATPPARPAHPPVALAPAPLICHVGGTMLPAIEEIAKQYREATGEAVELNTGDSGALLATIETQKEGDLYVCHDPFLDMLMARGLGKDGWTVAELTPVIAVPKGNPKGIRGLQDLARPDVELFLTDYEYSTLGRLLPTLFGKAGLDFADLNRRKTIHTHRSGSQAANVVKMGDADATIVWNAVAALRADALEPIPITAYLPEPDVDTVTSATGKTYRLLPVRVTVATLACAAQQERAAAFARFIAGGERQDVFRRLGYTVNPQHLRQEYAAGLAIPRP